jgi:quinol monooxygenase YgiN
MFGTIATMKVKPGQADALRANMEKWNKERAPNARGFVSATIYQSVDNPDEVMLAVVFENRDSYFENANSPEQDQAYREMLSFLQGEPQWKDGEVIAHLTP